jgi:enoyl-CoA hydratase
MSQAVGPGPGVRTRIEERAGGARIAWITIDNRAKLNIIGTRLMAELLAAIEGLRDDDALRAVVLTGAGDKAFIGGVDITEMVTLDGARGRKLITALHRCCQAIRELPAPVIARIRGYALGGGLEVAAACDLRVAADDARFGMPEVKVGIPSVIEAALLPMLIGWGRTREMLLLGETSGAAEAAQWGLVERVAPAAELDAAVERYIASILAAGPRAVRQQKALIRAWEDLPLRAAVAAGIDAFVASWETDEPRQAMQRFIDGKRRK